MEWTERTERGSALPLLVVAVVLGGALALQMGRLGGVASSRAQAQTAADAAALAGAADGEPAARALAEANGAKLVAFEERGLDTRVVVELASAQASGKARREGSPEEPGGPGGADPGGLAPAMKAALARAEQLLGQPVPITSGYRSPDKQRALWDRRASNPYPVAAPGTSMHERGLAVDVPLGFAARLAAIASQAGLCYPYPRTDPVHFEVCR